MVTLDRAMMVLQAVERDCEMRLIGSKKTPRSFGKTRQDKASAVYSGLGTEVNATSEAEPQPVLTVVQPFTTSQLFQSLLTRFQQGHARHGQSLFGLRLMTDCEIEVAQRDCPRCVLEVDGFLSFDHPDFEEPLKVVAFAHCAGNAPVQLLSRMLDRCIEAWEDFKPLSREAGSHLPAKFRKAMPIEPYDPSGIWYTFLLWCQTLEKEQFMNEANGLRPLSNSPFLDSVDAIEICELAVGKAILPPKLSSAIPSGQDQQFATLNEWARENLKGKQLRVLEMVVAGNGTRKIEEIAADGQIGWDEPYDPLWNSARQALNGKLKRLKPKWVLNTRNGSALLTKIEQK
jgi:hypothetical protein